MFLADATATERAGEALSLRLGQHATVLLDGPLGAGKTCFARGLLRARGVRGNIASPTYAILHSYPEQGAFHADLYRVQTLAELEQTGIPDGIGEGLWLVEWAERFAIWPDSAVRVQLRLREGGRWMEVA